MHGLRECNAIDWWWWVIKTVIDLKLENKALSREGEENQFRSKINMIFFLKTRKIWEYNASHCHHGNSLRVSLELTEARWGKKITSTQNILRLHGGRIYKEIFNYIQTTVLNEYFSIKEWCIQLFPSTWRNVIYKFKFILW